MSKPDVFFSVAQLNYLEDLFPAVAMGPTATEQAMRHYFGQQAVVRMVRLKTRGLNGSSNKRNPDDIPSPAG